MTTSNTAASQEPCPAQILLKLLFGKCEAEIFRLATMGPVRFSSLLRNIPATNRQSVSVALWEPEEHGLLKKRLNRTYQVDLVAKTCHFLANTILFMPYFLTFWTDMNTYRFRFNNSRKTSTILFWFFTTLLTITLTTTVLLTHSHPLFPAWLLLILTINVSGHLQAV